MDLPTQRQWSKAKGWLRRARWVASMFRGFRDFQRPPRVAVEPADQPSATRQAERLRLAEEYPLVSAADALGLATSWRHLTVTKERRPGREDYPVTTTIPKYCLLRALQTRLPRTEQTWGSVAALEDAYGRLGLPAVAEPWKADPEAAFAELRLSGPNPMFLRRYEGPIPGLETPVPEGSFAVAYDDVFQGLRGVSAGARRFFSPGIAVFELRDALTPTGIQLRTRDGRAKWFPADGSPAWRLAMMHFNSCDFLAHELLAHFLWTHVVAEKFLLATARNLTWRHPLRRLIAPHMAATLNNNNNATPVLIQRGGLFDRVFGAGERGKLVGLSRGEDLWHFDKMVPARHIAQRGLMDLPHYPYRDAALRLWDEVDTMVGAYLDLWYETDDRVLRDEELRHWSLELRAFAGPSVPPIDGRENLRLVVSAFIFNVMQHGFVNLLQYDALGYPPAYPANVRVDVPESGSDVTKQTLVDALPTLYQSLSIMRATCGFSIQYGQLGAHLQDFHSGESRQVVKRFARRLRAISEQAPAGYLPGNPANVGNSVDA